MKIEAFLVSYAPDIAAAPFLAPVTVPDFLAKAFRMDVRDLDRASHGMMQMEML